MGEFVEQSLEELLPVFEQLSNVQLLSSPELDSLVKRCRRYEYRLQKKQKTPDDFIIYGDYLADLYTLIKSRRARMDYWHKYKLIDKVILRKIASIYRRCCDRFQSQLDLWYKLFAFLKKYNLLREMSKAYTRALQVHGRNISLRCESALWEFFSNASAENARTQLQLALRSFPEERRLYEALFKVECNYVNKIMERRDFLKKKLGSKKSKNTELDDDSGPDDSVFDVDVEDSVLQMKVAEVVVKIGMKHVAEDQIGQMLLQMRRDLSECDSLPKESAAALLGMIEDQLIGLANEDTQMMDIDRRQKEGKDIYEAYDAAIENCPTERMYRLYMEFCDSRKDDMFATMKRVGLLKELVERGWANETDFSQVASAIDGVLDVDVGKRLELLQTTVKACPSSVVFWSNLLRYRMEEEFDSKEKIDDFMTTLNEAFDQVPAEETFPLWEISIDFAVLHRPKKVEKVFSRCFLVAPPGVASRVKMIRVEYLAELVREGHLTEEEKEGQIEELMRQKPNCPSFYLSLVDYELSLPRPRHALIQSALKMAVNEHSKTSVEAWIANCKYAMRHQVEGVAKLYQRAMLCLNKELCANFIEEWTKLHQAEAKAGIERMQQPMQPTRKRPLEEKVQVKSEVIGQVGEKKEKKNEEKTGEQPSEKIPRVEAKMGAAVAPAAVVPFFTELVPVPVPAEPVPVPDGEPRMWGPRRHGRQQSIGSPVVSQTPAKKVATVHAPVPAPKEVVEVSQTPVKEVGVAMKGETPVSTPKESAPVSQTPAKEAAVEVGTKGETQVSTLKEAVLDSQKVAKEVTVEAAAPKETAEIGKEQSIKSSVRTRRQASVAKEESKESTVTPARTRRQASVQKEENKELTPARTRRQSSVQKKETPATATRRSRRISAMSGDESLATPGRANKTGEEEGERPARCTRSRSRSLSQQPEVVVATPKSGGRSPARSLRNRAVPMLVVPEEE